MLAEDVRRFHRAQERLAEGDFAEGWRLYEARRTIPRLPEPTRPLPFPEWRGEPLEGRHVIVFGEQGFGDQIMFARFIPRIREMGATVTYVCAPEVAPLFPGAVSGISAKAEADFWVHLCSLPLKLGCEVATIPPPIAPPVPLGSGGGVGVAVQGAPGHVNDANRSLHGAEAARLLSMGRDLSPEITGARDFLDTARIVAGLDVVVSVDTSVAHLAGSMGKPTLILLPAFGTEWRWMKDRSDSPWYPSARLYRQPSPGDWRSVLDAVERDLQSRMKLTMTSAPPPERAAPPAAAPPPGTPPLTRLERSPPSPPR